VARIWYSGFPLPADRVKTGARRDPETPIWATFLKGVTLGGDQVRGAAFEERPADAKVVSHSHPDRTQAGDPARRSPKGLSPVANLS
jgi:hypothetical protein